MSILSLLAGLLVAKLAAASPAGVFTYEVPHYPRAGESCGALALVVGERLRKSAGVEIARAHGTAESATLCALTVTYVAAEPLPLVSTSPRHETEETFDRWHYTSLNDCAADVPVHASVFTEQTKLKPLVAYCYSTNLFAEGAIFVMKVEALGRADRKPASFTLPKAFDQQERIDEETAAAIVARGGVIARIAASPSPLGERSRDTIHYYADRWLGLQSLAPLGASLAFPDAELRFLTDEQCLAQQDEARRVVAGLGAKPVTSACIARRYHSGKFSRLEFLFTTETYPVQAKFPKNGEYDSLDKCLADRERMIRLYREQFHFDVRGALCFLYFDVLRTYHRMALYTP